MTQNRDEILKTILAQPSAPFREAHMIRTITQLFDHQCVPYFQDPIGNIVVGAKSAKEYRALLSKKDKEPLRIFVAHLDHPGFHGENWSDEAETQLDIQWHGGAPIEHLHGAKVWLADAQGFCGEGTLGEFTQDETKWTISKAKVTLTSPLPKKTKATSLYGGFKFRDTSWEEGDLLYTKAADDLVGSFCIVSLALDFYSSGKKKTKKKPFIGLLTRAEEVGFVGMIGHLQLGWLSKAKREVLVVSLETSRQLPGAEIGKGPVIRLGDRYTTFSPGHLKVFQEMAEKLLPGAHQKRIMDGGSCEATAAMAWKIPTIGISVPLGNYHNQGFEGGPDCRGPKGPAPEFVSKKDIAGLIQLCHGLMQDKLPWNKPFESKQVALKKIYKKYDRLIKTI